MARLTARDFEEGVGYALKDSMTISGEFLSLVLQIVCQRDWAPASMDITAAFLQRREKWQRHIHNATKIRKSSREVMASSNMCMD